MTRTATPYRPFPGLLAPSLLAAKLFAGAALIAVAAAGGAVAAPRAPLACAGGLSDTCAPGAAGAIQAGTIQAGAIQVASGGCGAAAAQAAAAQGGQVIGSPQVVQQGGRTMCVVTILVRDPTGQRPPERRQVVVPAN